MESALRDAFNITKILDTIPYSGRTDMAISRDLLRVHGIESTPANIRKLHEEYLARLPDCLQTHRGCTCQGISTLLSILRQDSNTFLGLLTGNIRRGAEIKLSHFGIWHHFACGGFGDDHFERNDVARSALNAVNNHLGHSVNPSDVWVVGDTPHDVSCARAIGANAIAVATGWHRIDELAACQPDLLLDDLSDPRRILELWD